MEIGHAIGVCASTSLGGPDAPAMSAETLTRDAISFTVTSPERGTYPDGTFWTVAGSGAQLTATAPTATQISGIILDSGSGDDIAFTDEWVHGMMVNPGQASNPAASLADKQTENMAVYAGQAWDGRRPIENKDEAHSYDDSANIDPGKTGSPVALTSQASYVKAQSDVLTDDQKETVKDYCVLTVVSSAPTHSDAARPALANPDKSSPWRKSDITLPTQDTKAYTGLPSYADVSAAIGYVIHMMHTNLSS